MSTLPHRDDLGRPPIIETLSIPAVSLLWDSDRYFYPVAEEDGQLVYPEPPPEDAGDEILEVSFFDLTFVPVQRTVLTPQRARELKVVAASLEQAHLLRNATVPLRRADLCVLQALGSTPLSGKELARLTHYCYPYVRKILSRLLRLGLVEHRVGGGYVRL